MRRENSLSISDIYIHMRCLIVKSLHLSDIQTVFTVDQHRLSSCNLARLFVFIVTNFCRYSLTRLPLTAGGNPPWSATIDDEPSGTRRPSAPSLLQHDGVPGEHTGWVHTAASILQGAAPQWRQHIDEVSTRSSAASL